MWLALLFSSTSFAAGGLDPYKAPDGSANVVMYEDGDKMYANIETFKDGKLQCNGTKMFDHAQGGDYIFNEKGCTIVIRHKSENEISVNALQCDGLCVAGAATELNIPSAKR